MTFLEDLTAFVCAADARRLPDLDRTILRRHAADVVIASIVGARSSEGAELLKVYGGVRTPEAIAGRAGLVRLTEMDDIHPISNTTPSSVAVSVALALAAEANVSPDTVESAIYVGTEVLVRFGLAMDGARALLKGFWPTRNAATLASCATAAKLWGLPAEQTHEALSLALTMTNGRSGKFYREPSGRWIIFAGAVANGLRAAIAARHGFNGGPAAPTPEWLSAALGTPFDGAVMLAGLGVGSVYPELSLKPYGTARQSLSAAEAMRALVAEGQDPKAIQSITIRVPSGHLAMIGQNPDPDVRSTSFVSVAAQVATAALMPGELYDVERKRVLSSPEIQALASKCSVIGDPEMDSLFPEVWGARLDLMTASGPISRTVLEPLGSPQHRMDDDHLAVKARAMLAHVSAEDRAEPVLNMARGAFGDPAALRALSRAFMEDDNRG